MHSTYFKMNKIIPLFITMALLSSCGGKDTGTVDAVIESNDLKSIRLKKSELVQQQHQLNEQIKQLDIAISALDQAKKIPLVTTFKLEQQHFDHYIELQGNVTTKDLLVIYPEFSGILSNVYVKEGQWVKKGQVLAKIDDGGLSQQLAQMKIQLELAKTTFERQQRLWDQKIGSEMQYLQAKSNYEAQTQAIRQLEQQVSKTVITAPFSGTIDQVITEQGNVVLPGQTPLMRLINLNNMYIVADVPEKHISNVKQDKRVEIQFPILGRKMESRVRQVGDFINPGNRTFRVEVPIPEKDSSIKPNLTVKLRINDYSNERALLLPQSIISENASGEQYIYAVRNIENDDEATAEKMIIETGLTQGDVIEVIKGLEPGMEIVREGARSVNDGQKIKIIKQAS